MVVADRELEGVADLALDLVRRIGHAVFSCGMASRSVLPRRRWGGGCFDYGDPGEHGPSLMFQLIELFADALAAFCCRFLVTVIVLAGAVHCRGRDGVDGGVAVSASRTVTKRVQAFYGESYRVSEDILRDARYPVPPLPYAKADELKPEDIEELADTTREALPLAPDKPIPNLTRAMERTGIAVALIVLTDPAGEEQSSTQNRPHAEEPEAEANRFAGALLVPRERAIAEITDRLSLTGYARLKATWGVSIQALIMRGYAVGSLSDSRKRSLYVQLTQRVAQERACDSRARDTPSCSGLF